MSDRNGPGDGAPAMSRGAVLGPDAEPGRAGELERDAGPGRAIRAAGLLPRRVELPTAEDTVAFGRELAAVLGPGDLVILSGALGAGKTVLTKGIAAGLGVTGLVASPTFVIARVHRSARPDGPPLVHVDAYRLSGPLEIDDLDLDTDLTAGVVVVEWGEGRAEQLADDHLLVRLQRRPDDTRTAELIATGPSWAGRVARPPES